MDGRKGRAGDDSRRALAVRWSREYPRRGPNGPWPRGARERIFPAMPEALAVFAVFVVAVIAWVGAWMQARDPARQNVAEDLAQLRHHHAWLEERVRVAEREGWGAEMIAALHAERASAAQRLTGSAARE